MELVDRILSLPLFQTRPPILIDVGASGEINPKWRSIAPYAICIAFDADDREFNITERTSSGYKKLVVINRIVTAGDTAAADFYLTASPFCSSLLRPETDKLEPWAFSPLFRVDKKIQLPATSLAQALQQTGVDYVDWFKSDSQGTDLRLFLSLPDPIRQQVLAAEFEPGIIDAYQGEDKLKDVMHALPQADFWLSTMVVKGTQRLHARHAARFGRFAAARALRPSPCWAELTYLRRPIFSDPRALLLLLVFALLERQYGFALEICDVAERLSADPIFASCRESIVRTMKWQQLKVPFLILKRQVDKLFRPLNPL